MVQTVNLCVSATTSEFVIRNLDIVHVNLDGLEQNVNLLQNLQMYDEEISHGLTITASNSSMAVNSDYSKSYCCYLPPSM